MKVRIECYDNSKPTIVMKRYYNDYYETDPDYQPSEDELESESEYDPDEEQVSDSEDGSDYEPTSDDEEHEDEDSLKEPTPYYGRGFTIYFDSHEDKKEYFKRLNASE